MSRQFVVVFSHQIKETIAMAEGADQLTHLIRARCSESVYNAIADNAKSWGLSPSELIRWAVASFLESEGYQMSREDLRKTDGSEWLNEHLNQ